MAAVAGLILLIGGATQLRHGPRPQVDADAVAPSTSSAVPVTDAPASTSTSATPTPTASCPPTSAPADPGASGCPPAVAVSGRTVTVGSRRFQLGQEGDVVTVGAWHCHGAMPALLRPATGEVFVFDSWASPGHDVTVQPTAVVPGALSLATEPTPDGCATLIATRTDGSTQPVPLDVGGAS